MEKKNPSFQEWRKRIAYFTISAAILAFMFLPALGSSSILSLSTAIASPGDNQGQEKEHCPPGVNHVPKDKHSYDVLVSICEGEKEHGNPHG
jgi:hypothetical protein